jgi:hypothetical protein
VHVSIRRECFHTKIKRENEFERTYIRDSASVREFSFETVFASYVEPLPLLGDKILLELF